MRYHVGGRDRIEAVLTNREGVAPDGFEKETPSPPYGKWLVRYVGLFARANNGDGRSVDVL